MPKQPITGLAPPPPVRAVADLWRIALAVSRQAALRYRQLAGRMTEAGRPDLAALFRELERQERLREAGIDSEARSTGVDPESAPSFRWQPPEGLTAEEIAEAGGEALMTPERALDLAVHHAQRTFSLFVRIATEAGDPAVRDDAERRAAEEIDHVARLRLERRRAARRHTAARESPRAFADTAALEGWLRGYARESEPRLARIARGCRSLRVGTTAGLCPGDDVSAEPASGEAPHTLAELRGETDEALRATEHAYETLLRTIEKAQDETLVTRAQGHAEQVLRRLAALSDLHAALVGHARSGD